VQKLIKRLNKYKTFQIWEPRLILPHYFRFDILASSNSISHDVLIVSRSSEYFHLDRSYFCFPCAACTDLTSSDLKHHMYNL
jgi:hypothetical protein